MYQENKGGWLGKWGEFSSPVDKNRGSLQPRALPRPVEEYGQSARVRKRVGEDEKGGEMRSKRNMYSLEDGEDASRKKNIYC
jgi:hypothetical protein